MSCLHNEQVIENLYDKYYNEFREDGWLPNVAKILALKFAWNEFYSLPVPDLDS